MSKRAIIYLRVSTKVQAEDGYSLPAQLDACREYATRFGWRIISEYVEPSPVRRLSVQGLRPSGLCCAGDTDKLIT